jgi:hypothetical protein
MTQTYVRAEPADFVRHAEKWTPGKPLPVIDGPELERYEVLLADVGVTIPFVPGSQWPGVVVSVGSPVVAAAAGLLAAATGRPHHHTTANLLRDTVDKYPDVPVALTGTAADLACAAEWLYTDDRMLGLVSTRTEAGLTALVLRTLTVASLPLDGRYTVSSMGLHQWDQADAVSVDEAAELRGRYVGTMVLRTLGRECAVVLSDGVLCGRSDAKVPLPLPTFGPAARSSACMRGGGCFFEDLRDDRLLPTASIRAGFILSQTCMTVSVGANEYPLDLGFGLGFMDGVSVAVLGPVGNHADRRAVRELYETCPPAGQTLGELLAELNQLGHGITGDRVEFALLGDPALRMPTSAPARPVHTAVHYAVPPRLAELQQDVLPRLARLEWLTPQTGWDARPLRNDLRQLVRHSLQWGPATADLEPVESDLAALQREVLTHFTDTTHNQFWDFKESLLPGLDQLSVEDANCPSCGRRTASHIVLRHPVERELGLVAFRCSACADLAWSTDPAGELRTSPPTMALATKGSGLHVSWDVHNTTATARIVHTGFAFQLGVKRDLPRTEPSTLRLAAGETTTIVYHLPITETTPERNEYTGMCVLVSEGHCHASPATLG